MGIIAGVVVVVVGVVGGILVVGVGGWSLARSSVVHSSLCRSDGSVGSRL